MMRLVKFRLPRAAWTISCALATRQAATRVAPALVAALLGAMSLAVTPAHAASAIAQYDQPKYPANFTHFDYADPDAPNTGTLNFENYNELQSYDSLNPFLVRGAPAPDIQNLMFDTLMQRSWDELASEYALIADNVDVAPDLTSATFHINPAARFSNGDPITAADVKYSFDTLTSPQASPLFNAQFSIIKSATVVDRMTIRFDFKRAERDAPLIAGDLPVFSPKWGMTADGKRPPFDQIAVTPPIASGPYLIAQRKNDKDIEYVRNPNYWAANLPTRRGMFRFDRIRFKLYLDQYTMLESFKAGDSDVRVEYSATQWARKYVGKNFKNGLLKQVDVPDGPAQMQGFLINLRRPMFKDVRVRHALALAFDYDWMNRMMFYGQYVRLESYFQDSPFSATGMPSQQELALLEPYRSSLPASVFGPMIKQADTIEPHTLRDNLRIARDLMAQAGWTYRDGALRNAAGTPFSFEILDDEPGMDRVIMPFIRNLQILGVQANMREIDSALYQKRLDNFQFDMTTYIYANASIPGIELQHRFGSAAAKQTGSENYVGVQSKVVDSLIQKVLGADTLAELETAAHALDRVLINEFYVIPQYHEPNSRIAYKNTIGFPSVIPSAAYQAEDWIIQYWYGKPQDITSASAH